MVHSRLSAPLFSGPRARQTVGKAALALALLLVGGATVAIVASQVALQCRHQPVVVGGGSGSATAVMQAAADAAAAATAAQGAARASQAAGTLPTQPAGHPADVHLVADPQQQAQQAGLQQQQQQQQAQQAQPGGRHARPPENDVPPRVELMGLAAARAAAAPDAVAPPSQPGVIPRNLHRVYIADQSDPTRRAYTLPVAHQRWIESCQWHHTPRAGWTYYFWDHEAAEALLANHYPWFLPWYHANATRAIERSDLVRYAAVHRLGGLYVDSDVECWREAYDMLEGFDFVGQATHGNEGATNAVFAARPGMEVFVKALQLVQTRDIDTGPGNVMKVIARTGPDLLTAALEAVGLARAPHAMFEKQYEIGGDVYRLWRTGAWYMPCQWWERDCRKRVYRERAEGRYSLWDLAGFHRMVGSWIPGKEDGIGILNVTAELCGTADHVRGNGQIGGWVAPQGFT